MSRKNNTETYIFFLIDFTTGICCMAQKTQTGSLYQPRGERWGGRWERGSKKRGYMCTYGSHATFRRNIKELALSGFENKTVSYSQLLQMANDSQIKKWFQGNDQIQNGTVKILCQNLRKI